MSTPTEPSSPFARPRFVIAAVVIGVIVVLAVVLAVVNASRDDAAPVASPTSASPSIVPPPTTEPSAPAATQAGKSVCGLAGEKLSGRLTSAPAVDQWKYQGTTAFPVSKKYGPGANNPAGFRYCFQHSPEGALFAASSAIVGSDAPSAWADYFLSAQVPNREAMLQDVGGSAADVAQLRASIEGFRLLQYTGTEANVDLAVRATVAGKTSYVSAVLQLTWEDGDWKFLPADPANPFPFVSIPDTSGYIPFTA